MEKIVNAITKDGKVPTAIIVVIWFVMEMEDNIKNHIDTKAFETQELIKDRSKETDDRLKRIEEKGIEFMLMKRNSKQNTDNN